MIFDLVFKMSMEDACKILNVTPNTRSKDCPGCVKDPKSCELHFFGILDDISKYYIFWHKDAPKMGKRMPKKQRDGAYCGRRKDLNWRWLSQDIGKMLLRWHAVFLDAYEDNLEDHYKKHFLRHGKIENFSFTIEEIENMRIGKSPDSFLYWHAAHSVKSSPTLPYGCLYRNFGTEHFDLLFTDGRWFMFSSSNRKMIEDECIGNINFWHDGILKWRELSIQYNNQFLETLCDNAVNQL